jgi:hypothetical protein
MGTSPHNTVKDKKLEGRSVSESNRTSWSFECFLVASPFQSEKKGRYLEQSPSNAHYVLNVACRNVFDLRVGLIATCSLLGNYLLR